MSKSYTTTHDSAEAERRASPSASVVFEAIRREGEDELERTSIGLFWSGLAAGLSMGFSLATEGLLRSYLPDAHWVGLVAEIGYTTGFLIVILGRQQLFTENTLTPILPLLRNRTLHTLFNVVRLWGVVLLANLVGCAVFGWAAANTTLFTPDIQGIFSSMAVETVGHAWGQIFLRGIVGGWLIALLVWLLPFAETARVWVIIAITYIIGLGHFSHGIAGSVDAFAGAFIGVSGWGDVARFITAALCGNVLGGVLLVALINYGQVFGGGEDGIDA